MLRKRDSGIELLKILAIFIIVIGHVVQTLGTNPEITGYPAGTFIDLSKATMNIDVFILQNMRYLGLIGNAIFFICSAWFLCDDYKVSKKKIISMCVDIWTISVVWLIIMKCIGVEISTKLVVKSLFPTTFATNWYTTFYILIYAVHPLYNIIIKQLKKRELLRVCVFFAFLYFGVCFFQDNLFFVTHLVSYSVLYFCIAYVKKYTPKYNQNIKLNFIVLIISIIANVGLIFLTDLFGLWGKQYAEELGNQILRWCSPCNPILILIAISLFNIFKELHFESKIVNYISSISLLVYVLHDNVLFRTYVRPYIYVCIYNILNYNYLLLWTFIYALILFLVSIVCGVMYKKTIQKVTLRITDIISFKLGWFSNKIECLLDRVE